MVIQKWGNPGKITARGYRDAEANWTIDEMYAKFLEDYKKVNEEKKYKRMSDPKTMFPTNLWLHIPNLQLFRKTFKIVTKLSNGYWKWKYHTPAVPDCHGISMQRGSVSVSHQEIVYDIFAAYNDEKSRIIHPKYRGFDAPPIQVLDAEFCPVKRQKILHGGAKQTSEPVRYAYPIVSQRVYAKELLFTDRYCTCDKCKAYAKAQGKRRRRRPVADYMKCAHPVVAKEHMKSAFGIDMPGIKLHYPYSRYVLGGKGRFKNLPFKSLETRTHQRMNYKGKFAVIEVQGKTLEGKRLRNWKTGTGAAIIGEITMTSAKKITSNREWISLFSKHILEQPLDSKSDAVPDFRRANLSFFARHEYDHKRQLYTKKSKRKKSTKKKSTRKKSTKKKSTRKKSTRKKSTKKHTKKRK